MELQQTFWQTKLSPKQLIIDWDRFIILFTEFILETISIKLNQNQKQYLKTLIDPEHKNIVYKNSYLIFVNQFWNVPSNRTKLLKGQINLSKIPKLKFLANSANQANVMISVIYLATVEKDGQVFEGKRLKQGNMKSNMKKVVTTQQISLAPHIDQSLVLKQKFYQWRINKIYTLDNKQNMISQSEINTQNFITIGRSSYNDIVIQDCQSINQEHLKLIKEIQKKKKQKKPYYMIDDEDKNQQEIHWYIRDVSKSNRSQYSLPNDAIYAVMRPGLIVKIGLLDQYQIHILKATPEDLSSSHIKHITTLLNADRKGYLGDIDLSIPQKHLIDIPIRQIHSHEIQHWYNKGLHYEDSVQIVVKKKIQDFSGKEEQIPLKLLLINTITQQKKQFQFYGKSVTIGRGKKNSVVIDKPTIRNTQCEFVCITGVWMIKNVEEKSIKAKDKNDFNSEKELQNSLHRKIKIKELSVGFATQKFIQTLQNSNKVQLPSQGSHEIKGKNFVIKINFPKVKTQY